MKIIEKFLQLARQGYASRRSKQSGSEKTELEGNAKAGMKVITKVSRVTVKKSKDVSSLRSFQIIVCLILFSKIHIFVNKCLSSQSQMCLRAAI